jgi:hypothetical protein
LAESLTMLPRDAPALEPVLVLVDIVSGVMV